MGRIEVNASVSTVRLQRYFVCDVAFEFLYDCECAIRQNAFAVVLREHALSANRAFYVKRYGNTWTGVVFDRIP